MVIGMLEDVAIVLLLRSIFGLSLYPWVVYTITQDSSILNSFDTPLLKYGDERSCDVDPVLFREVHTNLALIRAHCAPGFTRNANLILK